MSALRVSALNKSYGKFRALEDVAFEVRSGEVLGLLGPNGAGKTTLFECLAGALPRDAGRLTAADGTVLSEEGSRSALFYMPDGIAPWPQHSVSWALDYVLDLFGGRRELKDGVVRDLDLATLLPLAIGSLSKGQRKRCLLALSLLAPQPVVLVDEPFDGLDLRQTREVARALRAHAALGRTLFLSIHQIQDAARLCDRFVLLSAGQVRGEGTLQELRALAEARTGRSVPPDLEEVFLALA